MRDLYDIYSSSPSPARPLHLGFIPCASPGGDGTIFRAGPGSDSGPFHAEPRAFSSSSFLTAPHTHSPCEPPLLPVKMRFPASGILRGRENPAHGDVRYLSGRPEAEKGRRKEAPEAPAVRGAHLPRTPGLRGAHSHGKLWAAGRLVALGRLLLPDVGQGDEQPLGRRPPPGLLVRLAGGRARGAAAPALGAAPAGRGSRAGGRRGAAQPGKKGARPQGRHLHGRLGREPLPGAASPVEGPAASGGSCPLPAARQALLSETNPAGHAPPGAGAPRRRKAREQPRPACAPAGRRAATKREISSPVRVSSNITGQKRSPPSRAAGPSSHTCAWEGLNQKWGARATQVSTSLSPCQADAERSCGEATARVLLKVLQPS